MSRYLHLLLTVTITVLCGLMATPLDDYIQTPDPHYTYRYLTKYSAPGVAVHVLNMTSQKWLTDKVTTNPVWWHYLYILIPHKLEYRDSCFLWIDGGRNDDYTPYTLADEGVAQMTVISETTGSVTAVIKQIPNQPIVFQDDPDRVNRTEDAIIAWTWMKFLKNGSNPEILLRLPMTKAVVRGMDTVTSFVKDLTGNIIDKFVVAGRSKRGWTTWTTAAADKRIIGMVPSVMDMLNGQKNMHHHYRSLGGWTFAFEDYYEVNITRNVDSPNMLQLEAVVDPFAYNERYSMPKLIVTAGGDEFFLPDDSHYFYDQLQGPIKYMRIIPNADHSLAGHKLSYMLTLRSFYLSILEKGPFPNVTWVRSQTGTGGKISVKTSVKPTIIIVHHARTTDAKRRDFRLSIKSPYSRDPYPHPVLWFSRNATKINDLEYVYELQRPLTGWAIFFIQMTFAGAKNSTLEFTTEACIVPDTFPFPECSGESCYGTLV